jgi:hypothetical protein
VRPGSGGKQVMPGTHISVIVERYVAVQRGYETGGDTGELGRSR